MQFEFIANCGPSSLPFLASEEPSAPDVEQATGDMIMTMRRIVTAHNKDGRAIIASDVQLPAHPTPHRDDWSVYDVWAAENPHFPDAGERPKVDWFFPPIGGFRYMHTLMEPQTRAETATQGGKHRTATIDTVYVVKGRCMCELDDGASIQLNAGDTLIQSGAIHAWSNPFDEQCHVLVVMIGAHHDLAEQSAAA
jgi:quercetin dioxygenase-like cupin family protein